MSESKNILSLLAQPTDSKHLLYLGTTLIGLGLSYTLYKTLTSFPTFKPPQIPNQQLDTVYVYGHKPLGTLPEASPFVFKLVSYLRLHKIDHSLNGTRFGPVPRWPWVVVNGEVLWDTTDIIEYLEGKFGIEEEYSEGEMAVAYAVRRVVEESLFLVILYERFIVKWDWWRPVFLSELNYFLQIIIGAQFRKIQQERLRLQGMYNEDVIYKKSFADIDAISEILADKNYLIGDTITQADLSLHAMCLELVEPSARYKLGEYIMTKPNLVEFMKRVQEEIWPDYPLPWLEQ